MGPNLRSPRLMALKATLFVAVGLLASTCLLLECPSWRVAALLALAVWAFARAYYFAFYVIEKYVDPTYRFAGLWDFLAHRRNARRRRLSCTPPLR
jgi:hypothetical protein